jgi:hypothetical protein
MYWWKIRQVATEISIPNITNKQDLCSCGNCSSRLTYKLVSANSLIRVNMSRVWIEKEAQTTKKWLRTLQVCAPLLRIPKLPISCVLPPHAHWYDSLGLFPAACRKEDNTIVQIVAYLLWEHWWLIINHVTVRYPGSETFRDISEIGTNSAPTWSTSQRTQDESVANPRTASACPGIAPDSPWRTALPSHAKLRRCGEWTAIVVSSTVWWRSSQTTAFLDM